MESTSTTVGYYQEFQQLKSIQGWLLSFEIIGRVAAVAHFDFHKELFLFTLCMKMSPLDESVESDPDLLGAEVGQSVFPNVERVDAGISLLV